MTNFANGKVYAIRSHLTNEIYIGSTTQTLAQRMGKHRTGYRYWVTDNSNGYITSYEILKHGDAYIELLESFPCLNRDQLRKREGELIRTNTCVNKRIDGRTNKQYRQDNKESINQQKKQYYQDNAEHIKQQRIQYYQDNAEHIKQRIGKKIICSYCNITFSHGKKARHIRTKNHITNFKQVYVECWGEPHIGTLDLEDY